MGYNIENNDIQYCSVCGAVNKKSAIICCECERKIRSKHLPFCDFLAGHIKSDVKDSVSSSVFSLLRKVIVSHLYGTVLTVSVIATVAVSALSATPYIKTVENQPPKNITNETPSAEEEIKSFTLEQYDIDYANHLTTSYDAVTDSRRSGEPFYDSEPGPASKFWAEGNVPGYNFSGTHPLYNNPISINANSDDFTHIHEARMPFNPTNADIKTELGKQLQAAGYYVMECDYYMGLFDYQVDGDLNSFSTWQSENPARLCVYRFVFVRSEDDPTWYIADEILTQRKGI